MVGAGLSWLRIVDLVHFLCLGLRSRTSLAAENLFLRKLWFLKTSSALPGNLGDPPGRADAVDFESGRWRREDYTALFLSRSTWMQRDASLRDRTARTADGFFDCLGWAGLARRCA
jgi:hypothetical protein